MTVPERFLGDALLPAAALTMDRWAELDASAAEVWPWLLQLGKGRGGWYAPRPVERLLPAARRGSRQLDPRWQSLAVGDVVPDYGRGTLVAERVEPPSTLVWSSDRGRVRFTWALLLTDLEPGRCQLHHRLRLSSGGRLARTVGDRFDQVTIVAMVAGLRERLAFAPRG